MISIAKQKKRTFSCKTSKDFLLCFIFFFFCFDVQSTEIKVDSAKMYNEFGVVQLKKKYRLETTQLFKLNTLNLLSFNT